MDAHVWEDALEHDLIIPAGKYFLADAGFPLCDQLLVPYQGVRYHLAKWGHTRVRPVNKEELFNLQHASACNVIEHIFGMLKHQFCILLLAPEYSLEIQARIPAALCAVHNFIWDHDSNKGDLPGDPQFFDEDFYHGPGAGEDYPPKNETQLGQNPSAASIHCDKIAQAMWDHYLQVCEDRIESLEQEGDDFAVDDEGDFADDNEGDMD